MKSFQISLIACSVVCLVACGGGDGGVESDPTVRDYSDIFAPLPTTAAYPKDNQYSEAKEHLGELLFWDPILSGDSNVACASCHHPNFGWADGRNLSIGSDGFGIGPQRIGNEVTPIHSPSILNVAFTWLLTSQPSEQFVAGGYFWDLRAASLEEQALGPIQNPIEMLGYNYTPQEIMPQLNARLESIPEYVTLFEQAFGLENPINSANIAKALATFQRKIISPSSRFDQFMSGNTAVFTAQEIIGLNKFIDGGCARCHLGPMLSDNLIHQDEAIIGSDVVRTPTLRNISITAPYMHDGSRASLRDAINDYDDRGDIEVTVGEGDFASLEAFLKTLDSNYFYKNIPTSVPSGLAVGGNIE